LLPVNGLKYLSGVIVSMFSLLKAVYGGAWFYIWLLMIVFTTGFTFFWDVVRDWGLGQKEYGYLRKELLYPPSVKNSIRNY
jgi:hypothetical protein